ncbi:MAG: hypothetical protein JJU10_08240 [Idiomarina sp.]|nr:hypothetical protein [Idiomarina sp.]
MKKLLFCACLLPVSVFAESACSSYSCEGHAEHLAPSVRASDRSFVIQINPGHRQSLHCQLIDGAYARLDDKSKEYQAQRALVLSAIASYANLRLQFDQTQSQCTIESVEFITPEQL